MGDTSLQMEEGDTLIRKLRNGIEEKYLILNLKYYEDEELGHIEIDVRKETKIQDAKYARVEYHQYGNAGQVNIDSPGASLNITKITPSNIFEQLNSVIEKTIPDADEKLKLLHQVEELKNAEGGKSFLDKYSDFIASVANHVTLMAALTPFIPVFADIIKNIKI